METKNIQVILPVDIVDNIAKLFEKIDVRVSVSDTSDFVRYCILRTLKSKPSHTESSDLLVTAGDMCRFRKVVEEMQSQK